MNRELLEVRAIQQGREADRASDEVDAILEVVRSLNSLRLTTSAGAWTFELRLQGSWK